jgi:hypothetical protein
MFTENIVLYKRCLEHSLREQMVPRINVVHRVLNKWHLEQMALRTNSNRKNGLKTNVVLNKRFWNKNMRF